MTDDFILSSTTARHEELLCTGGHEYMPKSPILVDHSSGQEISTFKPVGFAQRSERMVGSLLRATHVLQSLRLFPRLENRQICILILCLWEGGPVREIHGIRIPQVFSIGYRSVGERNDQIPNGRSS